MSRAIILSILNKIWTYFLVFGILLLTIGAARIIIFLS